MRAARLHGSRPPLAIDGAVAVVGGSSWSRRDARPTATGRDRARSPRTSRRRSRRRRTRRSPPSRPSGRARRRRARSCSRRTGRAARCRDRYFFVVKRPDPSVSGTPLRTNLAGKRGAAVEREAEGVVARNRHEARRHRLVAARERDYRVREVTLRHVPNRRVVPEHGTFQDVGKRKGRGATDRGRPPKRVAVGGGVVVATGERWSLRGVAVVCCARARRGSIVVEGRRSRVEGWRAVVLRGRVARGRSV